MTQAEHPQTVEGRPLLTAFVHDGVIEPHTAETILDAIHSAIDVAWASTWEEGDGMEEAQHFFTDTLFDQLREATQ